MQAFYYIKFILKVLIYIILLPLFLMWFGLRYLIYQYNFRKGMRKAGVSNDDIRRFMHCKRKIRNK